MTRIEQPTEDHQALHTAFCRAIETTGKDMDAMDILAVASQFVGQLIAMQDASLNADSVMQMVHQNMVTGNQTAIISMKGQVN